MASLAHNQRFASLALSLALLFTSVKAAAAGQNVQLWECETNPENHAWKINTGSYPKNKVMFAGNNSYVLDVSQWKNTSGTNVQLWHENNVAHAYNQQFHYDADQHHLVSLMNEFCVTAESKLTGSNVAMYPCSKQLTDQQQWTYNQTSGQIQLFSVPTLCLDTGSSANCSLKPYSTYTYCDPDASVEDRVNDLLPRLELAEKTNFLNAKGHTNGGVPRLGVTAFTYGESLHGVNCGCGEAVEGSTGCPTSFPHALGLGATFNRSIWTMVGQTIATEGRALHNQGLIGLAMWAPDINLFRDPRWGRGQEVPGEDPYLTAEYVAHYSRALQEGEDPRYLKLISSCKHFSAYDLEIWDNVSRHQFNAIVSDQDLVEYYWVPFRSCVQRAHAKSIMCSYNAVNGIPSCANDLFQNEIVRNEWGFDGFFVSDCGAISNIYAMHNFTNSTEEACKVAIEGGTDTNCGQTYNRYLEKTVSDGLLTEAQLDVSVRRVMAYLFRTGVMDPPESQPYTHLNSQDVDTTTHRQIALEAAQQAIVLLKNDKSLLPLSSSKVKSIALIGPQANATTTLLSNYYGGNTLVDSHSILAALTALVGHSIKINFVPALQKPASTDTSAFSDAAHAAKGSDVAIVCIGLDNTLERENHDRTKLTLPGVQQQLVDEVFQAQPNTVVVLINGGPLAIESIKENIPAILEAFYPGELGGDAVADVLFGEVNPSGRLPYTVYPADYIKRSFFDMSLRGNGGCTYMHYTGDALFEFGFGLSYTTFNYSWGNVGVGEQVLEVHSSEAAQPEGTPLQYTVVVENTGTVAGADTVLGFLKSKNQSDAPIRELFDFGRVYLEPGCSATVHLTVGPQTLSLTNADGVQSIRSGEYEIQVGTLTAVIAVRGPDVEIFNMREIRKRHQAKSATV